MMTPLRPAMARKASERPALLQVTAAKLSLNGSFWTFLANLNFGNIGYLVVGLFVATWAFSVILWKSRRIEARWGDMIEHP